MQILSGATCLTLEYIPFQNPSDGSSANKKSLVPGLECLAWIGPAIAFLKTLSQSLGGAIVFTP